MHVITETSTVELQAFLTKRKGGKKFAVFDLTISLKWEGKWGLQGKKVRSQLLSVMISLSTLQRMFHGINLL